MNNIHLLTNEYVNFINRFDYKYIFIPILFVCIMLIVIMYLCYLMHSIIHELGHLTYGLISGCRFLSLRIGKYALVRDNGNLRVKIHRVKGSGGQCLLGEPKHNYRIVQYGIVLGGICFNLSFTILSLIISYYVPVLIKAICYLFCFNGVVFTLMNGLPLNNLPIINDGKCFKLILHSKEARKCFYLQSRICRLLFESKSYGDIPIELFDYDEDSDLDNELIGYMIMMRYYHYLEKREYKMASWCLSQFEPYEDRLSNDALVDLYYERLFTELLTLKREHVIEKIMNCYLMKREFNKESDDMNQIRVRMAYELIHERNHLRGMQYYNKANLKLIKHQVAGEVKFQYTMIIRILKSRSGGFL